MWGSRIYILPKLGEGRVTLCGTAFLSFTLRFCIAGIGGNRGWSSSHMVIARQSYLGTRGQVISPSGTLITDLWTEEYDRHENRYKGKIQTLTVVEVCRKADEIYWIMYQYQKLEKVSNWLQLGRILNVRGNERIESWNTGRWD